jgi:predicted AAA+ superfamily ATPase
LLFESLVVRDLRVYAQARGGRVLHVRDEYGLEVDAIIELPDGTWAAFEVKLSGEHEDEAAANLHRFVEKIDTAHTGEPVALVVITADRYGYTRDDGVAVVPLSALAP